VVGDLLEHLADPQRLLDDLRSITMPAARIICCIPNMTHYSVFQKLISGDLSYEEMGLWDKTHLKFYSPSSAFKIFLDSGWLPNLVDQYRSEPQNNEFVSSLLQASTVLGIPTQTSLKNLGMYQMILDAKKFEPARPTIEDCSTLSVVVPVNREWQFNNNIMTSPGLKEINSEIIPVRNCSSAAEAFHTGKRAAKNPWILFLHQDVYVPKGSGNLLLKIIEEGPSELSPIGFCGLQLSEDSQINEAGLVIDRTALFKHEISGDPISADEFAILMHKNCAAEIDPNLGWHLWATDLFLQSYLNSETENGLLVNAPLFHNSLNDYSLPADFHVSAKKLLEKYPNLGKIETLCGTLTRSVS
jgi:hypothetical protein